ncbi:fungal hydrophobin-domain-containing protein [Peziza echinospora]|nr:fungal hydrophobin-domain-containing protein [Peziza echinospora]
MLAANFLAFAFAAGAFAIPAMLAERQLPLCTSGTPLCCATDVLELADLDCHSPPITPNGTDSFIDICSAEGQQAKCCLIPILGQALLCSDVNPTAGRV